MEAGLNENDENNNGGLSNLCTPHVHEIIKVAHEDLRRLIQQRIELTKRIGTIKQTILGLGALIGDARLGDDLRELVRGKGEARRPGLTRACRTVLIEAGCPVNAQKVCEQVQQTMPGLPNHKNLVASVIVILNRLAQSGEARRVLSDDGRRAWLWVSDAGVGSLRE